MQSLLSIMLTDLAAHHQVSWSGLLCPEAQSLKASGASISPRSSAASASARSAGGGRDWDWTARRGRKLSKRDGSCVARRTARRRPAPEWGPQGVVPLVPVPARPRVQTQGYRPRWTGGLLSYSNTAGEEGTRGLERKARR